MERTWDGYHHLEKDRHSRKDIMKLQTTRDFKIKAIYAQF